MNAIPFDTLKFARALRDKAKLSPEQAEGFADAIGEAIQSDLATKADLLATRTDLRTEIQATRTDLRSEIQATKSEIRETELRLKAEIEASKAEIVKWMFGTIGFQTLIVLGAVIALARVAKP
ncbi:CCDC90 family protein [Methylobacterium trifolii]|uniref:DUF1640 domain-containing protein n=1 Tax=Methylobacterium trifolii TaxID=1003092 RepID=A0ABQ4TYS1_9HYPH|nr:CCDC90 family protein [Methylobacterium trifolii]GJE60017.1 hypothetical protein MPOCJGCO_2126 [Methylobacterium trifolii]